MTEEHGHGAILIRAQMWMVDGAIMEVALRLVGVERKQEYANVQVHLEVVQHVLEIRHNNATHRFVM